MAKIPVSGNETAAQGFVTDPEDGFPNGPATTLPGDAPLQKTVETDRERYERLNDEMSFPDRVLRLENIARLYFGAHHFEAPALAFNPDAEREAARARFLRDMENIETTAKNSK